MVVRTTEPADVSQEPQEPCSRAQTCGSCLSAWLYLTGPPSQRSLRSTGVLSHPWGTNHYHGQMPSSPKLPEDSGQEVSGWPRTKDIGRLLEDFTPH